MAGLSITKTHGSRNDILVIDGAPGDHLAESEVARAVELLCDRRYGLGADGAYFLADDRNGTARAWFFNPDGSEALLCGNGMRGVGRLLLDRHGAPSAVVRTGPYAFTVRDGGTTAHGVRLVAVELPPVDFAPGQPIVAGVGTPFVDQPLGAYHTGRRVTALAVPNAHLVSLVDAYDQAELVETGQRVARDPEVFPLGANVSFVQPLTGAGTQATGAVAGTEGADEVFIHTYERGAGLTLSCGSGVAASRAVLSRLELVAPDQPVLVRNPGGVARSWLQPDGASWQPVLEGNGTLVAHATVDAAALLRAASGGGSRDGSEGNGGGDGDGSPVTVEETYLTESAAFAQLSEENTKALSEAGVRLTLST